MCNVRNGGKAFCIYAREREREKERCWPYTTVLTRNRKKRKRLLTRSRPQTEGRRSVKVRALRLSLYLTRWGEGGRETGKLCILERYICISYYCGFSFKSKRAKQPRNVKRLSPVIRVLFILPCLIVLPAAQLSVATMRVREATRTSRSHCRQFGVVCTLLTVLKLYRRTTARRVPEIRTKNPVPFMSDYRKLA